MMYCFVSYRILNDMRIIAADWMGNTSHLAGQASRLREEGVGVPVTFRTRPAAPTAGQVSAGYSLSLG
jgi:hypothetical protein